MDIFLLVGLLKPFLPLHGEVLLGTAVTVMGIIQCVSEHVRRYLDWGVEVNRSGGSVIGVAIDTQYGEILYGVNGSWNSPMGVAFLNIKKDIYCPAISGCDFKCSVNCGQGDFKFGPPDPSFKKVIDF